MFGPIRFDAAEDDINHDGDGFRQVQADLSGDNGSQVARFFATTDASSGTATLTVALVKDNTVIAQDTATITPTARLTAADNGSGRYVATVEFSVSGNDKIDLLGQSANGATAPIKGGAIPSETHGAELWWYGITGLSTVANVDVYHAVSPKV